MGKRLFIAEKPSVAQEFAKALKVNATRKDGYMESADTIVTWCVGHLVTMSYPEVYDPALKKWSLSTLPFLPDKFLYEVIPSVKKQFDIVSGLLNREDVDTIYVCTDSGREGEYIYRLVDDMAHVSNQKDKRRVWIDSQTPEEIMRGIEQAKPIAEYDNLADAAYLRAKEDYLMGINFSRVLTLKYGNVVQNYLNKGKWSAVSVGRVMTCVLGMVVKREREIRSFVKTPFYRVIASTGLVSADFESEWRAVKGSRYFETPALYKENGFCKKEDAQALIEYIIDGQKNENGDIDAQVVKVEKKKENKSAPLLFNLAELQNVCSKMFKISPDETLKYTQELYEKKLVTYPRTDARVLSTAVSKVITQNLKGLTRFAPAASFATEILEEKKYVGLAKTKYVNDKQITDHYAIIPTGQGFDALAGLNKTAMGVYMVIVRRFLSIFYPPAVYLKVAIETKASEEHFFANFKVLKEEGYYKVAGNPDKKKKEKDAKEITENDGTTDDSDSNSSESEKLAKLAGNLKKGDHVTIKGLSIKEGETSPPKRYSSGTLILAMENAGQLIEDEELRAQIKGSGIGTSATRAEILNKLVKISYLKLNKKTQIITPTYLGEGIYDVVNSSITTLLNPELTASWEKGLTYVAEGKISKEEYMQKLTSFVTRMTQGVKGLNNQQHLVRLFKERENA